MAWIDRWEMGIEGLNMVGVAGVGEEGALGSVHLHELPTRGESIVFLPEPVTMTREGESGGLA